MKLCNLMELMFSSGDVKNQPIFTSCGVWLMDRPEKIWIKMPQSHSFQSTGLSSPPTDATYTSLSQLTTDILRGGM